MYKIGMYKDPRADPKVLSEDPPYMFSQLRWIFLIEIDLTNSFRSSIRPIQQNFRRMTWFEQKHEFKWNP
jgi:hypothetical protein